VVEGRVGSKADTEYNSVSGKRDCCLSFGHLAKGIETRVLTRGHDSKFFPPISPLPCSDAVHFVKLEFSKIRMVDDG
jgi:hypothetical protein